MDWCLGVEEPLINYILPIVLPVRPYEEAAYTKGKADLDRQLATLESHLASSGGTFLVGHALTLADVLVAWTLITPFLVVRSQTTMCALPHQRVHSHAGSQVWRCCCACQSHCCAPRSIK